MNVIIGALCLSVLCLAWVVWRQQRKIAFYRTLSEVDPLTGLKNRRAFEESATKMLELLLRLEQPAAFLVIDVDHFKRVNDGYGHPTGDAVLRLIASALRSYDLIHLGRIGGDELVVLLPGVTLRAAADIAERLRVCVCVLQTPAGSVTVSIGAASTEQVGHHLQDLFDAADAALLKAKGAGRNRVAFAPGAVQVA